MNAAQNSGVEYQLPDEVSEDTRRRLHQEAQELLLRRLYAPVIEELNAIYLIAYEGDRSKLLHRTKRLEQQLAKGG